MIEIFLGSRNDRVCEAEDKKCSLQVVKDLSEEIENCNCLEECETLSYEVLVHLYPAWVIMSSILSQAAKLSIAF